MGFSFSCPFAVYHDLVNDFESSITNSFIYWDEEVNNSCQSISYEATETEQVVSADAPLNNRNDKFAAFANSEFTEIDDIKEKTTQFPALDRPKHKAAIKLQKVYKSFRTRRKLADCAVVIEQSWWKLLDFAELKLSSISFFDTEKHETAISRWSRARTRAAKVGKGLSKNSRAQKLALQHWLEAIDPRHRYGHNLRFYYNKWIHCQSKEPFFYWLDIGEGKEVNLVDKCPRSKLQHQCIKYLGPMERMIYEVVVEKGKFCYKQSGKLVDTTGEHSNVKWIFVLSTSMTLYVGQKQKGTFQHSSFLAGGATSAAGRIVVQEGILKAIWPHSGHYRPTPENFHDFILFLSGNNVDLTDVKMDPVDEEDSFSEQGSVHRRNISSEEDPTEKDGLKIEEMNAGFSTSERTNSALEPARPKQLLKKLTNILIPNKTDFLERLKFEYKFVESSTNTLATGSSVSGYETADNLFDYNNNNKDIISKESIMKRINSLKGMNSYQLGKQLSCKWTTGAGPRIGCVRDYPSRLQFHALEQVDLSPRSAG